jgi:hypothetical protein
VTKKTKQFRGSLIKLINEIKKNEEIIGELLENTIQKTTEAMSVEKDTKRVADYIESKIDQIFEYRDRYNNDNNKN